MLLASSISQLYIPEGAVTDDDKLVRETALRPEDIKIPVTDVRATEPSGKVQEPMGSDPVSSLLQHSTRFVRHSKVLECPSELIFTAQHCYIRIDLSIKEESNT